MLKLIQLAIDFDGTVVEHQYPGIGPDVPYAVKVLKALTDQGYRLILFTMRSGPQLQEAVNWYEARDIPLYGIQKDPVQHNWTTSPKAYAQIYIDDAALGAPLIKRSGMRPYVDWKRVTHILKAEHGIDLGVDFGD